MSLDCCVVQYRTARSHSVIVTQSWTSCGTVRVACAPKPNVRHVAFVDQRSDLDLCWTWKDVWTSYFTIEEARWVGGRDKRLYNRALVSGLE